MADRLQALQNFEFDDAIGRPLCPEIFAAVLRKNSFNVDQAVDQLERVTAPSPCPTSIPGQWQIWDRVTMWGKYAKGKPLEVEGFFEFVEGLRGLVKTLEIKDKRSRAFCDDIIVGALQTAAYDPLEAADYLIVEADRLHGRERASNLEAKRAAYGTLATRFPGPHWYSSNPFQVPWHAAGPGPWAIRCP
jgi:hypothetical protein